MTDVTQPSNHDAINLMLAKKIKELPEDRQVVLLKQLLKGDIVGLLFKLIGEMSEERQALLLEQLQDSSERLVSLEETEIALRDYNRKSCMLNINFMVENKNFESFMLDISPSGAFIETKETFFTGQQIYLNLALPNLPQPLNISGEILWKGMLGMGVKFYDLSDEQIAAISAYIEEEEI
ncbi:MAG: PilZ domain-containing protein [Desulfobacteraceae bacterium]|jgi:Tfp pilus assembly protein PilZ|nr:PilZ domain-containing protein [Desulfobacteraceae bacterium]